MPPKILLKERFERKVAAGPGCMMWMAYRDYRGYGRFAVNEIPVLAHRVAYELYVGPIPDGLTLDHLCRNHSCVNVQHLEPVTHRVNCQRGKLGQYQRIKKKNCVRGHPYNQANTYIREKDGSRVCRACARIIDRKQPPNIRHN